MRLASKLFIPFIISIPLAISGCGGNDDKEKKEAERQKLIAEKREKETIAIESQRILSVTRLIEGAARQPEIAPALEQAFQDYAPLDNDLLKSEHCQLVAARTFTYSFVVDAIVRQPEVTQFLLKMFSDYAGDLNPDLIKGCDLALYNRSFVIGSLIEANARRPEAIETIKSTVIPVIGTYSEVHEEGQTSTELELAGALQVQYMMFIAAGRQPELKPQLEVLLTDLLPEKQTYREAQGCLANQARLFALGAYMESKARQPEIFNCGNDTISICPEDYIGELSANKAEGPCQLPYSYTYID